MITRTPKWRKFTAAENRARLARLNNGERYIDPRVANKLDAEVSVHEECMGNGDWWVEYSDGDGGCYVTIFTGPAPEHRARDYFEALKTGSVRTIRYGDEADAKNRQARSRKGASYIDPSVTNGLDGEVSVHQESEGTGDWLVEYGDGDGAYVTIFSGPAAEPRARGYFRALTRRIKTIRLV
jgi:hypothetical protein